MISDQNIFKRYVDWLPAPILDEVYFVSLSARNKYLTPQEREYYGLGRTEMFSREIARDKPGLSYVMSKLQASLAYRRTRTGKEIPHGALVVYMNVNPSSTIAAYQTFKHQMDTILQEALTAALKDAHVNFDPLVRAPRHLMNAIQKSRSRRLIIDIDVDTTAPDIIDNLRQTLREQGVDFACVGTCGGYHVLVRKHTLGHFRLYEKLQELQDAAGAEVCVNANGMVPVPGTLQAGTLVTFELPT